MRITHWLTTRTAAMAAVLVGLTTACTDNGGPSDPEFFADRIAFTYRTDEGGTRLATVNPDGSDIREIALPATFRSYDISGLAWTKDHSWLAFMAKPRDSETDYDIFVVRPTGSNATNITQTPDASEHSPTWSPDGRQLAFERNGRIMIVEIDGSGERELVGPNPSNSGSYQPEWSPDGTTIVYISGTADEIWTVNASGSTEPQRIRSSSALRARPTWKPGGSRILMWEFDLSLGGSAERMLLTIAPDGDDPQEVESPVIGETPSWSPDGTHIAVLGEGAPNLSIVNLATSEAAPLTLPATPGSFAWK